MSAFMLNVLQSITVSRAVCTVNLIGTVNLKQTELVTRTEEILNSKFHFLCSENSYFEEIK